MLEAKWPQKYNHYGHVSWTGRVYGTGVTLPLFLRRWWVYHGVWGTEPFQRIYSASPGLLRSLPLMPEWYLVLVALLFVAMPGVIWHPLLVGAAVVDAWRWACRWRRRHWRRLGRCCVSRRAGSGSNRAAVIATLHLLQPVMRLQGRMFSGLTPWRRPRTAHTSAGAAVPHVETRWDEHWQSPGAAPGRLEQGTASTGASPCCAGACMTGGIWRSVAGILGGVRMSMAIEEHGADQLVRLRAWPKVPTAIAHVRHRLSPVAAVVLTFSYGAGVVLAIVAVSVSVRADRRLHRRHGSVSRSVASRRICDKSEHTRGTGTSRQ